MTMTMKMTDDEAAYLMQDPEVLGKLIDYRDLQQDQSDSMGAETTGDAERAKELRGIATQIIAEDPDIWHDSLRTRFGFGRYYPPESPPFPCIYLAGPINGRSNDDCHNWREMVKAHWVGFTLDPMARDYRGREEEPGIAEQIVQGDTWDLRQSDGLLAYIDAPSAGTSMEILLMYQMGRPRVLVNDTKRPLSPWLTRHASAVCGSLPEALQEMKRLLKPR